MGLFSRNFNKPGPGVEKDEPRKKGVARFFELLSRDFFDLVKLNLMFCVVIFPSVSAFLFGILFTNSGFGILLGIALSFPVGGGLTAYYYYVSKIMRDDPSYVWFDFKRKFVENYKQTMPIGMLCMGFIFTQVLLWVNFISLLMLGEPVGDMILFLLMFLSLFVFTMILPYIFLHFAYVQLGTLQILKNSVMLTFGYLPRSVMGAIMGGLLWTMFALFFPDSLLLAPVIILFGVSLSILLALMWVWPVFDKCFKVEETLIERQQNVDKVNEDKE